MCTEYLAQCLECGVRGLVRAGYRPPAAPSAQDRRGKLGGMGQGPHLGPSKPPSAPYSLGQPKTAGEEGGRQACFPDLLGTLLSKRRR